MHWIFYITAIISAAAFMLAFLTNRYPLMMGGDRPGADMLISLFCLVGIIFTVISIGGWLVN